MTRPQGLRRFTGPPGPPGTAPGAPPPAVRPAAPGPDPEPAAPASGEPGAAEEHCEFCAAAIPASHGHVADLEQSSLKCACRACYLLFTHPGASSLSRAAGQDAPAGHPPAGRPVAGAHGRYHAVPDRYLRDPSRVMSAADWDELQIPVGLAFFLYRSQPGELGCFYPSPAGATECALDLPAWQRLAAAHPLLAAAEPDVEAVLICRPAAEGAATMDYFIVPIDACYELAGRLRMLWRGFDGGTEARASIEEFLGQVRRRAKDVPRQDARHG